MSEIIIIMIPNGIFREPVAPPGKNRDDELDDIKVIDIRQTGENIVLCLCCRGDLEFKQD